MIQRQGKHPALTRDFCVVEHPFLALCGVVDLSLERSHCLRLPAPLTALEISAR